MATTRYICPLDDGSCTVRQRTLGTKLTTEYTYDTNGNLTKDLNKNITDIQYNYLNLPKMITFLDGSTIVYLYSADGTKLRTTHKTGNTTTTTDYCSNVIYENGTAKLLLTETGYVSLNNNKYHYYLQDHQGNNRAVINQSGNVEETNHYYPFGGVFASTGNVQLYKYNGKELDMKNGLNWLDYGARHYDAALGRWHVADPLVEKFYSISPYSYCLNNPVRLVDFTGEKPSIYEAALIAKHVYGDKGKLAGGWKVSTKTYANMTTKSGFQSALYERSINDVTEYTFATAGTQITDWRDIKEDITQLWGKTKQYDESVTIAQNISDDLEASELTFVGHSLGGGLAAANALVTDKNAITFNPAALSSVTKRNLGLPERTHKGSIYNVVIRGEIVDLLQSAIGLSPEEDKYELNAFYIPINYSISHSINTALRINNHLLDTIINKLKQNQNK